MDEEVKLNSYVFSEIASYIKYTKVWAKTEQDARELLCDSYPGYETPDPQQLGFEFWNHMDGGEAQLYAVNGVYENGYAHMKSYLGDTDE